MRKPTALAIAAAVAFGVCLPAQAGAQVNDYQTTAIKVTKNKLPKNKFVRTGLRTGVSTPNNDQVPDSVIPAKATRTVLHFNRNLRFRTGSTRRCQANLEGTTTAQARQACPNASQVSRDNAATYAGIKLLPLGMGFPATVTAFNGPGKNQITLHARVEALAATTLIVGTVRKSPLKGFTRRIVFPVPLVGGGAGAIDDFFAHIQRGNYVQARCSAKRHRVRAITAYLDRSNSVAQANDRCRRR